MSGWGLKKEDLFAVVAGCGYLVVALIIRPGAPIVAVLGALAVGAALPSNPFRAGIAFALPVCIAVSIGAGAKSPWYCALLILPVVTVLLLAGVVARLGAQVSSRWR